ncbi:hypothetical protein CEXT_638481 [Caerostris extrusa]|uniref:Transposase Tc1-like domain-containing protein n=1 Tax=Caerostris extrusa TaxID=172846 RepID=A0AAV4SXN8_CAEEX|nr:hypothetical protein CEXT_638481 [Caerostris extrusa]
MDSPLGKRAQPRGMVWRSSGMSSDRQSVSVILRRKKNSVVITDALVNGVDHMFRVNRRRTVEDISEELGMSFRSVRTIIMERPHYRRLSGTVGATRFHHNQRWLRMVLSLQ